MGVTWSAQRIPTAVNLCFLDRSRYFFIQVATVRSKIVINNNIIEPIYTFDYLRCSISYKNEQDVTLKISKFLQIKGIIHRTLKPSQTQNTQDRN
jgi:hypothetical protein